MMSNNHLSAAASQDNESIKFDGTKYQIIADSFSSVVVSNSKRIREIETERIQKDLPDKNIDKKSTPTQFVSLVRSLLM